MLYEPPVLWAVMLNVFGLAAIQFGCAYVFTRMPESWFNGPLPSPHRNPNKISAGAKRWKSLLPDGSGWFSRGFRKRSLRSSDAAYLHRFIAETRRGEACHWTAMILCAVPFLWNPWWGCAIIAAWALISNVPCIALQRVNRGRLARVCRRLHASKADAKSARS